MRRDGEKNPYYQIIRNIEIRTIYHYEIQGLTDEIRTNEESVISKSVITRAECNNVLASRINRVKCDCVQS